MVELVGLEPTTSSLRTIQSTKKPQFGVHLAADYGPKRSNSDGFAGSCLTTFPALAGSHAARNSALDSVENILHSGDFIFDIERPSSCCFVKFA